MRIGICSSIDNLPIAREAVFAFAELGCHALLPDQDEAAFAPVRSKLLASPLPVEAFNCFLPGHLAVTGPAVDLKAVGAHMDLVLRRASESGASIMVFGSGRSRKVPDGFPLETAKTQFIEAARLAGELADRHAMTVVLEPLYKKACNLFNLTSQGIDFVDRINHPRVRLLTDLFHMAWEQEPFDHLVAAGPRLAHIHLATPCLPEIGNDNGPGYDFPGFLAALKKAGYAGRLSIEDNPGLLGKTAMPLVEAYRRVFQYIMSCSRAC
jgi:sugar phosphate isomerase/epimerase